MNTDHTFRYPVALTIAGSDSSGGAGIQADLKTFSALGVYGASVITAITAQNTQSVRAVQPVTPSLLQAQLAAVWEDIPVDAVKIGMLATSDTVRVVHDALQTYRPAYVVLDPVLLSTSGQVLLEKDGVATMVNELFPLLSLLTPNLPEAEYLTGIPIRTEKDREKAASRLLDTGCRAVLIKGGHGKEREKVDDYLFAADQPPRCLSALRVDTLNSHGTGCTLSSAIAAYLALGHSLFASVEAAKHYITGALSAGTDVRLGGGHGPVNHFFAPHPLHKIRSIIR